MNTVLIATKVRFPMSDEPNDAGLSRHHIISSAEASLKRLGTDHIDLFQLHGWDGQTPLEETLGALDFLVASGKVRYIGASNFSAWHLMKALAVSERDGLPRFVSQQIYYSLQAREAENELVPVSIDQGLGILVWSPLAGGLLSGKYRRQGTDAPEGSRHLSGDWSEPPIYDQDKLYDTIEVLIEIGSDARCVGGPDRTRLPHRQAGGHLGDRRCAYRGPTRRQPCLGESDAEPRRGDAAGRSQRRAASLPVLAPGREHRRPAEPGRFQPARQPHRLTRPEAGTSRQRKVIRLTPCPRIIKFNSSTKYRGGL